MDLNFDMNSIVTVEFGTGRDIEGGRTFAIAPIDNQVQEALQDMLTKTASALNADEDEPKLYEPTEKYASQEALYIPTNDEYVTELRELHTATNLETDADALNETPSMFCYFARFVDQGTRQLTAVRRATQFKGILKSRLIRFFDNTLQMVNDDIFKLDRDFDMLIDSDNIQILRPSGFEFVGRLQAAIRSAVKSNVQAIQADIPFVEFENIQAYAQSHTRAARYLASISSQKATENISRKLLRRACKTHGVEVQLKGGKIEVSAGHEMAFLDILDRRRYVQELIEGSTEHYKASGRQRL